MLVDEKFWDGNSSRDVFRPSGTVVLSTTEVPVKSSRRPLRTFCTRVSRTALEPGLVPCRPECAMIDVSITVSSEAPPIYQWKQLRPINISSNLIQIPSSIRKPACLRRERSYVVSSTKPLIQ